MGPSTRTRLTAAVAATGLALLSAPGASAQVPPDQATFSASATGTVIHAEAIEQPELGDPTSVRVVDTEVAQSSAITDSAGLATQRTNEYGSLMMPAQDGKNSYGRGYGLDVSLGQEGQAEGQIQLAGLAEASAPPTSDLVTNELGPVPASPLAYASTLRGEAYAAWPPPQLGGDLAYGLGYVEKAELVDTAADDGTEDLDAPVVSTSAASPDRSVSWSQSHTFLGPQTNSSNELVGQSCGVIAETRQTIAPVTLLAGTPGEFTIEFAGEWVLRAHAGGVPGSAYVHYGPGDVSPETPLLSILQPNDEGGQDITRIITSQDLFGEEGLVIDALPLAEIVVGEDPRAIGGAPDSEPTAAADGTAAAAGVDVVRVRLLSDAGVGEAAEVRVGHMEVTANAPSGGIDCGLPIEKSVDKALVHPGDAFTYTIEVTNPHACELRQVKVVDTLTADPGVTWTVTGTDPAADAMSDTEITWNDIGPIPPGESRTLTVNVSVDDDSKAGFFHDVATATALCFDLPQQGEDDAFNGVGVPLDGEARLDLPEVQVPAAAAPPALPRTGASALLTLGGLGLAGAALALRKRR